jgi:divalent metal cation (Fe/Co/Zn/Cd) transporter
MKIANERKSAVLSSNAVHHRVDSLTSFVALLTIAGAHILPDASWLDPVGGLIISLMVIRAGLGNTSAALLELADVSVDTETKNAVRRSVTKALVPDPKVEGRKGVEGHQEIEIRDVQGIKSGPNFLMEIELAVPGSWPVDRIRVVEDAVRNRVGAKIRGVKRVKLRFVAKEKKEEKDFLDEFIGTEVSPRSSPEVESDGDVNGNGHNHGHEHDHKHEHGVGQEHEYGKSRNNDKKKK